MNQTAVYMMANRLGGVIDTGVTSDLCKRVWQHREGTVPGFTTRYGCKRLVWYELHDVISVAIVREKQIKAGSRLKKRVLIEAVNPAWDDLYPDLVGSHDR